MMKDHQLLYRVGRIGTGIEDNQLYRRDRHDEGSPIIIQRRCNRHWN